jgi:hypothetical protein
MGGLAAVNRTWNGLSRESGLALRLLAVGFGEGTYQPL